MGVEVQQRLAVIVKIDLNCVRAIAFQQCGKAVFRQRGFRPVEQLQCFVANGVDATWTRKLASVRRIDDQPERARQQACTARLKVIPGEEEVQDLQGQRLRERRRKTKAQKGAKIRLRPVKNARRDLGALTLAKFSIDAR